MFKFENKMKTKYGKNAVTKLGKNLPFSSRARKFTGIHWLSLLAGGFLVYGGFSLLVLNNLALGLGVMTTLNFMLPTILITVALAIGFKQIFFRKRTAAAKTELKLNRISRKTRRKLKKFDKIKGVQNNLIAQMNKVFNNYYASGKQLSQDQARNAFEELKLLKTQFDKNNAMLLKRYKKYNGYVNSIEETRGDLIKYNNKFVNRPAFLNLGMEKNLGSKYNGNLDDAKYNLHNMRTYILDLKQQNTVIKKYFFETGNSYNSSLDQKNVEKFIDISNQQTFDIQNYEFEVEKINNNNLVKKELTTNTVNAKEELIDFTKKQSSANQKTKLVNLTKKQNTSAVSKSTEKITKPAKTNKTISDEDIIKAKQITKELKNATKTKKQNVAEPKKVDVKPVIEKTQKPKTTTTTTTITEKTKTTPQDTVKTQPVETKPAGDNMITIKLTKEEFNNLALKMTKEELTKVITNSLSFQSDNKLFR